LIVISRIRWINPNHKIYSRFISTICKGSSFWASDLRLIQLKFVAFLIKEITIEVDIEQQNINDVNNKQPKKRHVADDKKLKTRSRNSIKSQWSSIKSQWGCIKSQSRNQNKNAELIKYLAEIIMNRCKNMESDPMYTCVLSLSQGNVLSTFEWKEQSVNWWFIWWWNQ